MDFPPWQTVYWQFQQWEKGQVTERILEELHEQVRLTEGRAAEPSAGVLDSQSVKAADTVTDVAHALVNDRTTPPELD